MTGYYRQPAETSAAFTSDGFMKTGDIGVMDAKGYTRIIDRKKDMIIVSGFNVFPSEVENVIATHPATTTHQRLPQDQKDSLGITPGLIRLSLGLEDAGDLVADLNRALSVA